MKTTNIQKIKNHLVKRGSIDTITAIEKYGIWRLGAVIFYLKDKGLTFKKETVKKKHFGEIKLVTKYTLITNQ